MNDDKKFHWKSFISFGLFFSFFILAVTGLVLFIAPPGRVAKWVDWRIFGFSKDQWQAQHIIFAYISLILSVFHLFSFNWKIFLSYLKSKASQGFNRKREFILTAVLAVVISVGTLGGFPPFQQVIDLGESLAGSWEKQEEKAPMSHTEDLSLKEISGKLLDESPKALLEKLRASGIEVSRTDQRLAEIAKENNTSAYKLYQVLSTGTKKRTMDLATLKAGGGIGRKSLQEIADAIAVEVTVLVEKLKKEGIEAAPADVLKDIAAGSDKKPSQIIDILNK